MADPFDHLLEFEYDDDSGIENVLKSTWYDPNPSELRQPIDHYVNRVAPYIAENVESRLGINLWHRRFRRNTVLHPSLFTLGKVPPPIRHELPPQLVRALGSVPDSHDESEDSGLSDSFPPLSTLITKFVYCGSSLILLIILAGYFLK